MHKGAEATGQAELLAMAEAKVVDLDKQVKAGRPLPARYQAAEAKVSRALAMQDAALAKVVAMEAALDAGVTSLQETMDALVEAQQDLAATKLELGTPSTPQKEEGLAEIIQGAVNGLIQKGALVPNNSAALCAKALTELVAELLEAKGKPPIPRLNEEMGDGQGKGDATPVEEAPDPKAPEDEEAAEESEAEGKQTQEGSAGLAAAMESAKAGQAAAKVARTSAAAPSTLVSNRAGL